VTRNSTAACTQQPPLPPPQTHSLHPNSTSPNPETPREIVDHLVTNIHSSPLLSTLLAVLHQVTSSDTDSALANLDACILNLTADLKEFQRTSRPISSHAEHALADCTATLLDSIAPHAMGIILLNCVHPDTSNPPKPTPLGRHV
jgi:hypothetical protein